jgi:Adaptin N terminal region
MHSHFDKDSLSPKSGKIILHFIQLSVIIIQLFFQGEALGTREATECFFAMTKLFQSKDLVLRRMVYLGIKELSTVAEDVVIVTSSLTKDMTSREDHYRAPAIRALCSITDSSMLQAVERYVKQCIVDRNPSVSSAALVSSLHQTKPKKRSTATTSWCNITRWACSTTFEGTIAWPSRNSSTS